MPHIILEHSAPVADRLDLPAVLQELHLLLAQQETFTLEAIKSRTVSLPISIAGDPASGNVFTHLTLAVLAGRASDILQQAGQRLHSLLSARVAQTYPENACKVSLEIREMDGSLYWK